jgi:hypothetical protein
MQYLILFHGNSGCTNVLESYVYAYTACLCMEMKWLVHFCIFANLQMSLSTVQNVFRSPNKVSAISVLF